VGAPLQHFVSTPCPHAWSATLRLHTLSLRFVESNRRADGWLFVLVLVLVLVLEPRYCRYCRYCRRVATGIDRWRQDRWPATNAAQSGADIPVCARPRGQTGMSAPHYHAPSQRLAGTASPHLCWRAFAEAHQTLDPHRPQPPPATPVEAGCRRCRQAMTNGACYRRGDTAYCLLPTAPAYCYSPTLPAFLIS
jgi:hypothetical protein